MGERTEFALGRGILLCGNVAAPLTDRKGDLHLGSRCEMANDQFGIQHLEERKIVRNVSCGQLRYARHVDRHLLGVLVVDRTDETDFFEIQDNIDHTLHHPRDSGKLVVYTGYFDRRNRIPLQRREQDTAQSVADGHSNPGSSGRNSNFPNDEVDSSMITFSGFWNANIAIMNLLLNYYLEYNSTISCSLMFSGISSRSGFWRNLPLIVAPSHSSHA